MCGCVCVCLLELIQNKNNFNYYNQWFLLTPCCSYDSNHSKILVVDKICNSLLDAHKLANVFPFENQAEYFYNLNF